MLFFQRLSIFLNKYVADVPLSNFQVGDVISILIKFLCPLTRDIYLSQFISQISVLMQRQVFIPQNAISEDQRIQPKTLNFKKIHINLKQSTSIMKHVKPIFLTLIYKAINNLFRLIFFIKLVMYMLTPVTNHSKGQHCRHKP